ncbi:hypothetical protein BZG36_00187 [Bifiguratus adelaidae]|uniref:Uncharacterized protein n=1 Tax=Bifiguratus adelaidae TaxID=1938954 RepID=A0A261Y891_9FUNG|nr:hypothetical protein BZG36_00187 [Bifiguratus adelaidae]
MTLQGEKRPSMAELRRQQKKRHLEKTASADAQTQSRSRESAKTPPLSVPSPRSRPFTPLEQAPKIEEGARSQNPFLWSTRRDQSKHQSADSHDIRRKWASDSVLDKFKPSLNPFQCTVEDKKVSNSFEILEGLSQGTDDMDYFDKRHSEESNSISKMDAFTSTEIKLAILDLSAAGFAPGYGKAKEYIDSDVSSEDDVTEADDDYDLVDPFRSPASASSINEDAFKRGDNVLDNAKNRTRSKDERHVSAMTTSVPISPNPMSERSNLLRSLKKEKIKHNGISIGPELDAMSGNKHSFSAKSGAKDPSKSRLRYDWACRHQVICTSPAPFNDVVDVSQTVIQDALQSFLTKTSRPQSQQINALLFRQCLLRWEYPSRPLSEWQKQHLRSLLLGSSSMGDPKVEMPYYDSLYEEWRTAFTSLYYTLLAGDALYFYYVCLDFTALFLHIQDETQAIVNRSTVHLRRALAQQGVPFIAKTSGAQKATISTATEALNAQDIDAYDGDGLDSTTSLSTEMMDENNSLLPLLVVGSVAVEQLYKFLLKWRGERLETQADGPPQLISPSGFLYATVKSAQVTQSTTIKSTQTRAIPDPKGGLGTLYSMHIDGTLLPTSYHVLTQILNRSQNRHVQFVPKDIEIMRGFGAVDLNDAIPVKPSNKDEDAVLMSMLQGDRDLWWQLWTGRTIPK